MLNTNLKNKLKPKPTANFKNCSHVCEYVIVHNCRIYYKA